MQAIVTKSIGATHHRGYRIHAVCSADSLMVAYNPNLGLEENHKAAAERLRTKLLWRGENYGQLHGGQLPTGDYAWVMVKGIICPNIKRHPEGHTGAL